MFHIITCLERGNDELIDKVLKEFLYVSDEIDATLECFKSPKRLLNHLNNIHEGKNYLIILGDFKDHTYTLDLAYSIRSKLRNCYILFASKTPRLLYKIVNQNTRISGFVALPLIDNTLLHLVKQAYRDYKDNECEDSGKALAVRIVRGDVDSRERILMRIPFESIYFIEATNRKIRYVLQAQAYSDNSTLTERELELDGRFVRCHNSFIVNIEKIWSVGKNDLQLKNGDVIPVSRAKKKYLKQVLMDLHMNVTTDFDDVGEEVLNVY